MADIKGFMGDNRFLSNFYPCFIEFEGINYPSVEHAFVAAKTLDISVREEVRKASTPGKAKRIGRKLILRSNWNDIRLNIMETLIRQKFHNALLRKRLLDTGDSYLEETNSWGDIFWGVCNGVGHNNLGKILMKIRNEIQLKEKLENS